ncbi:MULTISPECIES: DUF1007 family protein [Mesorhizobium]|uniref:DUF1007 family protein n=1 Tax=Mesorhizobium denitrificans TaxID=2294114 RepID=A0A371XE32_9HYPH|nr:MULTISPECIES: DUF1007 family protein [Mesorhizobium]RFC67453.1 DUF1007 family protein [Mesorhizobium denitrificans]
MKSIRLICAFGALALGTASAAAHPHVFAEARLDVMLAPDGRSVQSLRHLWRFDDVFSSTVLVEFDKNGDNKLDDTELAAVRDTVYKSLGDYNYFQLVTANGKDVAMQKPDEFAAIFDNNQLIIMFETKPKDPLKLSGTIDFGVYDSTFYTAIDFTEDDQMAVAALPADCTRKVVRPDPDQIIAQNQKTLTDAFMSDPAGTDMSKIFATRLELTCPAQG